MIIWCWPVWCQWGDRAKMRFGHNFWLEGPIYLRPTRQNCILQDLFRDTRLDHIWRTQICIFGILGHIWHILLFLLIVLILSSAVSQRNRLGHILGPELDVNAFTTTYTPSVTIYPLHWGYLCVLADFIDVDCLKKQEDQKECLFEQLLHQRQKEKNLTWYSNQEAEGNVS